MSSPESNSTASTPERLSLLYRNWNILGAIAIGSLALVLPGPNTLLAGLTGLNVAQAGIGELGYQHAKKNRKNKKRPRD